MGCSSRPTLRSKGCTPWVKVTDQAPQWDSRRWPVSLDAVMLAGPGSKGPFPRLGCERTVSVGARQT
jgi:hypothetical protein